MFHIFTDPRFYTWYDVNDFVYYFKEYYICREILFILLYLYNDSPFQCHSLTSQCYPLLSNYLFIVSIILVLQSSHANYKIRIIHTVTISWMICFFVGGDPIIKKGRTGIPLISLTLPHLCACLKPVHTFSISWVVVFFVFNDWWEVIGRFAGGIGFSYHLIYLQV